MPQLISNLAVGSKFKYGSYKVEGSTTLPIIWKVIDKNHAGYPLDSVTLLTDKIIDLRGIDAKEPLNADTNRASFGNDRYLNSNIRQWLNSGGSANTWWVARNLTDGTANYNNHDTTPNDAGFAYPTGYDDIPAFLNNFTALELTKILDTSLKVAKNYSSDGTGWFESVTDKVFLLSSTEVGFTNENSQVEGSLFSIFNADGTRLATLTDQARLNTKSSSKPSLSTTSWNWWLRTPAIEGDLSYTRQVNTAGARGSAFAMHGDHGIRPAMNVSYDISVSDTVDADGCYIVAGPTGDASIGLKSTVIVSRTTNMLAQSTVSVSSARNALAKSTINVIQAGNASVNLKSAATLSNAMITNAKSTVNVSNVVNVNVKSTVSVQANDASIHLYSTASVQSSKNTNAKSTSSISSSVNRSVKSSVIIQLNNAGIDCCSTVNVKSTQNTLAKSSVTVIGDKSIRLKSKINVSLLSAQSLPATLHLYVFSSAEQLQAVLINNGTSCPFYDAIHDEKVNLENTFTFAIPSDHSDAKYVIEGSLIAFQDLDSNWQLFEVKRIVDTDDGSTIKYVYCDHAFYELLGDIVPTGGGNGTSPWLAMISALSHSRWEAGNIVNLGIQTTAFSYQTALACIQQVATTWKGELQFRIVISNNLITHRYVDLVARRGNDTGKQFVFGKDLEKVEREVDFNGVCTAMYGRGKATTTGSRLNFASINSGKEYVEDAGALAQYGIMGRHRFGIFDDSQEEDPANLLAKTQTALQLAKAPIVNYQFQVISLEQLSTDYAHEAVRIGDTCTAIDDNFVPALQTGVRVIQIQRNLIEYNKTKITLGNFKPDLSKSQLFQNQINRQVIDNSGIWDNGSALIPSVLDPAIYDLTSELRSAGGYVVFSKDDGIMVYNTPDPATATQVMKLGGGIFGIANSKINGEWNWRTFGDGGGFTADLITAGKIMADRIQIGLGTIYDEGYNPAEMLDNFVNETYTTDMANIKNQIDGNITSWFYAYAPTMANEPTSLWTTEIIKATHLGDLFYDSTTGFAYRFSLVDSVYQWVAVTDSGITKALADAQRAQDTADGKRRVFVVTPTTPYDVGDLWTQGASGDLMRCSISRATGAYVASDWIKASKYTDDAKAEQAIRDAANAQATADGALKLTDIEQGNVDFLISATNKIAVNSNFYWDVSGFYAVNGSKVVRITSGGIGISKAGIGGAFSTAITGDGIIADVIKSGTLDCSLLNVTNLVVGVNVAMGSGASISWANVSNKPTIPTTASQVGARADTWLPTASQVGARPSTWLPTASEIGARPSTWLPTALEVGARSSSWLPTPSQIGSLATTWVGTTYINEAGLYTGKIIANQIVGGTIDGVTINAVKDLGIIGSASASSNPRLTLKCGSSIGKSTIVSTPTNPGSYGYESDTVFINVNSSSNAEAYRGAVYVTGMNSSGSTFQADFIVHGTIQTGNGSTFAYAPFGADINGNVHCTTITPTKILPNSQGRIYLGDWGSNISITSDGVCRLANGHGAYLYIADNSLVFIDSNNRSHTLSMN